MDSSLDDILQAALDDFNRPDLLAAERKAEKFEQTITESSNCKEAENSTSPPPASADFFTDTAKDIDDVLENISQEDPLLAEQLRNLTNFAANISCSDDETAMKSFGQFATLFKATLDSVSNSAGLQTEDIVDDDLNALMNNLEKLAFEERTYDASSSTADTDGTLSDAMKALLSKEMMYESLVCCKEEYEPWLLSNGQILSARDNERYRKQLSSIKRLIEEYESDSFCRSQPSDADFRRVISMIAALQDLGEFPPGLMSKLPAPTFANPKKGKKDDSDDELEPPDCTTS